MQAEMAGLVKLDILKLKNVTELDKEVTEINELYNKNMTLEDIPLDDKKTWEAFKTCNTKGVFQFSSPVALPVLRKMQCSNMEELAAANSFIRPGTGGLDDYVRGKKDPTTIKKWDERIDYWLRPTYGAIVFQEQIMGLISELMGISFGQADIYRRALEKMHKPANKAKVEYFNNNVVNIAIKRGFTKEAAEFVRKMIIDNSGYAFNKSHAVCYSYISYYTAWMKVNYPLIFHKTMLNGNLDALGEFLDLAREDGVKILPPSVKYSELITIIENEEDKSLRIGFNTINGVGAKAVESIVANRPYETINDFFEKNNSKATNKKVIEALIEMGTFDGMGIKVDEQYVFQSQIETLGLEMRNGLIYLNRKQLFEWYKLFLEAGSPKPISQYEVLLSKIKNKYIELYELVPEKDNPNITIIPETFLHQMELNVDSGTKTRKKAKGKLKRMMDEEKGGADPFTKPFVKHAREISIEQINTMDIYLKQVDQNGFSFFEHPLQKYASKITNFKEAKDGDLCIEAGIILGMIQKTTSNKKIYYWLMLRTPRETVRITVWDNVYKKHKNKIKQYGLIAVKGKKGYGGISLDDIKELKRD